MPSSSLYGYTCLQCGPSPRRITATIPGNNSNPPVTATVPCDRRSRHGAKWARWESDGAGNWQLGPNQTIDLPMPADIIAAGIDWNQAARRA